MSTKVKTITVTNESTSTTETIPAAISLIYYNDKNNLNVVTDSTDINSTTGKGGKINIEAASDIQFKPGDDMILYSHHRTAGKNDEVAVKVTNGDDIPVKLQINAANLTITTKDKDLTKVYSTDDGESTSTKSGQASTSSEDEIFDINVNTGKTGSSDNKKAYLKVRARAIDLRCEEHGGIALQPKGTDSTGVHNKIKFEHGGGDGLEFFTMNDDKMSAFTNEYRFNKKGVWYMTTRTKIASDKIDASDETTSYKYVKADDDFYDNIDSSDEYCTTNDLIKTAYTFNGDDDRHAHITSSGNIEIETREYYSSEIDDEYSGTAVNEDDIAYSSSRSIWDGTKILRTDLEGTYLDIDAVWGDATVTGLNNGGSFYIKACEVTEAENPDTSYYYYVKLTKHAAPDVKIISGGDIEINANDTLSLKGSIDFGSTLDFGELEGNTDSAAGLRFDHKLTKKQALKPCDVIGINVINNSTSDYEWTGMETTPVCPTSATVAAGSSSIVASCSVYDIIKLVNYMKTNSQGPWASAAA